MAKYSYEFKKKVIKEYLNNEGSLGSLAKKHGIKSHRSILNWVNAYKKLGNEGVMRSRKNAKYTFEFKLSVVELYLTTEISYQELALNVGINNPAIICRWVNDFQTAGPDALREKRKGRKPKMNKPKKNLEASEKSIEESEKYLKQVEDENLKLRIENAYLKEVRRLRLEQEALNKKRELSVTSQEISN